MMKHTLTAAALAVVLASPAFAQTAKPDPMAKSDPAAQTEMNKPDTMMKPDAMKSDSMKPDTMMKPDAAATTNTPTSMPAQAQNSTPEPTETFVQVQDATDWRGSKLIGASVYGPDNSSIGEINDVLIANDGSIKAAVIGVGGFLGIGEKNVAVAFEQLSIVRKPESESIDKVTVKFTKDQLKNAPKFAYYEPGKAQTTGSSTVKTVPPVDDKSKK